jgi:hypothetical protein
MDITGAGLNFAFGPNADYADSSIRSISARNELTPPFAMPAADGWLFSQVKKDAVSLGRHNQRAVRAKSSRATRNASRAVMSRDLPPPFVIHFIHAAKSGMIS